MRKPIQAIASIIALFRTLALAEMTPLHEAVRDGNTQLVIALIEAGAHTEAKDKNGETPLHAAAARNRTVETVGALIEAGADGSARTEDGRTAFDLAEEHNQEKLKGTGAWGRLNEARDH